MWQRLYDEDEKSWQNVTEADARYSLSKAYGNVDGVMAEIKAADGKATPTGFAYIRWVAETHPCHGREACVKDSDVDCP